VKVEFLIRNERVFILTLTICNDVNKLSILCNAHVKTGITLAFVESRLFGLCVWMIKNTIKN